MTDREQAARAIGYLEGLSVWLWSQEKIDPECVGRYDEQVEILRKAVFEVMRDE